MALLPCLKHFALSAGCVATVGFVASCGTTHNGTDNLAGSGGDAGQQDAVFEAGGEKDGNGTCPPHTCAMLGANCGTAPDGCGGIVECGACNTGQNCGAAGPNKCGVGQCVAKTCAQLGASCGIISDMCSATLECGTCGPGQSCSANHCVEGPCPPKTCAELGASCGLVSNQCEENIDCGACGPGESCDPNHHCGPSCVPKTCADVGAMCGESLDGCGKVLHCGACGPAESCTANQCVCTCTAAHASTTCVQGKCAISSCDIGWADCDKDVSTGCETSSDEAATPNGCFNGLDDDCDGKTDCGEDPDCDGQPGPLTGWGEPSECSATLPECGPSTKCSQCSYNGDAHLFCRKLMGVWGWYAPYDPINPSACGTNECDYGCCESANSWCHNGQWASGIPTSTQCPGFNPADACL